MLYKPTPYHTGTDKMIIAAVENLILQSDTASAVVNQLHKAVC